MYQKFETQANVRLGEIHHLTEDQRSQVTEKCAVMQQFIMALQSELEVKPKHEDPSSTLPQLDVKQMLLEAEVNAILNTPEPEPVKEEETKAEEPAGEEAAADAEMPDLEASEKPAADADM